MNEGAIDLLEQAIDALAEVDTHDLPDAVLLQRHVRLIHAMRRLDAIRNDAKPPPPSAPNRPGPG